MGLLNRSERQILRNIQAHLHASILCQHAVVEQIGTVDVYCHLSNPAPQLNCAAPHKGVAWARRDDLLAAFKGLERLGRIPRVVFLDALFPAVFQQQLELMGLTPEHERVIMVYRPLHGPSLPGEMPRGRLPDSFDGPIDTTVAAARADLATWLRVFRAAYYNAETLQIQPGEVEPLLSATQEGRMLYVLGSYQGTPLGAARAVLRPPTAELEAVATAPFWHGMGLEDALVSTAVGQAMLRGCDTVFTIAPPEEFTRLYFRLGFVDLSRVSIYWCFPGSPLAAPQAGRDIEGENTPHESDLVQSLFADD